ncbi:hypothetical protein Cgig2_000688 [Carnegiea gigantea]|uniref:Autophagy-related protein 9 n=1 Tax=Carnegiea gigantea TaxID=171969 RepID=A0A9Q1KD78_9CARY|nr:hypothetical protein Cgig2_000688 [Carnegiea gigantea]
MNPSFLLSSSSSSSFLLRHPNSSFAYPAPSSPSWGLQLAPLICRGGIPPRQLHLLPCAQRYARLRAVIFVGSSSLLASSPLSSTPFLLQGGGNAPSVFNWKRPSDSSLTTGLLNDVHPEIELSDYGRVPSPGSESPSGLLNGESLKVEPIADLDLFFERLYSYYCEKGLWCIIVKWIVELLSLAFTICFSGFFLLYVDWDGLRNAKCGMDAVESGIKPCDLAKEALHQHPLTPLTLPKAVILGYLGIFSTYWIFCFFRFFAQLKETLRIRHFYYNSLHVTDSEIKTMPWASVLEKVVRVQSSQQLCVVKDLSAHDIVMRLMRKENYVIGMINKGVLAFPISKWIPGAGPKVKSGPYRRHRRLMLTKTLEWTLNWCILQSMFDRHSDAAVRSILELEDVPNFCQTLKMGVGYTNSLPLSSAVIHFAGQHGDDNNGLILPSKLITAEGDSCRVLGSLVLEVEHLFRHRLNSSVINASNYLKQFPSPIISIVAKFISFISGGFAAVLIIIAFLDESLLEGHIFGRNLFWYAAVFGTITAISRAAVTDELLVLDPEGAMSMVVQQTHYMPKRWRGKENTEMVRIEFETLFQYSAMMWLEEMASIFLTPYLLIFVVPKRVDDILQFIAEFTVNVEGVGDVCSFQTSYPSWQPDPRGMQFLTTLRTFRDQKLQAPVPGYACSPPREQSTRNSYFRRTAPHNNSGPANHSGSLTRNSYFRRTAPHNNSGPANHSGSLWLIETDPKTHPYLLDWFYLSGPHQASDNSTDAPAVTVDIDNQQPKDFWMPPSFHNEVNQGEPWPNIFEFQNRSTSHLGASTSSAFFPEQSVLRDHDSSSMMLRTRSHWWARGGPGGLDAQQTSFLEPPEFRRPRDVTQASFLEPPNFNHQNANNHYESYSERSVDEEEQQLDWENYHTLSRTTHSNEFAVSGEFKLHFDDIFQPSEPPTMNTGHEDLA